ncbi:MAG TPA: methyltransferase [Bacteroidales bacterium]|nr:methyltransferase [Bacteroidales bacterium]
MYIPGFNKVIEPKLLTTQDGSKTLWIEEFNEPYHSIYGAIEESLHVFIHAGLGNVGHQKQNLQILEVGLGTGLNALLAWDYACQHHLSIHYLGVEPFPPATSILLQLDYPSYCQSNEAQNAYAKILSAFHQTEESRIDDLFWLKVIQDDYRKISYPAESYDCIFFDAFRPDIVPELWETHALQILYDALAYNGVFVTYSAKGQVRRNLHSCGFLIEKLPGPRGKREITLARKR